MNGVKIEYEYPVLNDRKISAVKNEETANMAKTFAKVHSSDNIRWKKGKEGRVNKAKVRG